MPRSHFWIRLTLWFLIAFFFTHQQFVLARERVAILMVADATPNNRFLADSHQRAVQFWRAAGYRIIELRESQSRLSIQSLNRVLQNIQNVDELTVEINAHGGTGHFGGDRQSISYRNIRTAFNSFYANESNRNVTTRILTNACLAGEFVSTMHGTSPRLTTYAASDRTVSNSFDVASTRTPGVFVNRNFSDYFREALSNGATYNQAFHRARQQTERLSAHTWDARPTRYASDSARSVAESDLNAVIARSSLDEIVDNWCATRRNSHDPLLNTQRPQNNSHSSEPWLRERIQHLETVENATHQTFQRHCTSTQGGTHNVAQRYTQAKQQLLELRSQTLSALQQRITATLRDYNARCSPSTQPCPLNQNATQRLPSSRHQVDAMFSQIRSWRRPTNSIAPDGRAVIQRFQELLQAIQWCHTATQRHVAYAAREQLFDDNSGRDLNYRNRCQNISVLLRDPVVAAHFEQIPTPSPAELYRCIPQREGFDENNPNHNAMITALSNRTTCFRRGLNSNALWATSAVITLGSAIQPTDNCTKLFSNRQRTQQMRRCMNHFRTEASNADWRRLNAAYDVGNGRASPRHSENSTNTHTLPNASFPNSQTPASGVSVQ